MARRDGGYLCPAVDAGLRAPIGDEHGRRTGQRGCALPSALRLSGSAAVGASAERFVTLHSFGIDWRLLVATGALLFIAGAAMMLAAAGLYRRLGTNVPPSQPTTLIATTGPYRWTRNPMYLGMALIYAGLAIGFDGPIAFALLP